MMSCGVERERASCRLTILCGSIGGHVSGHLMFSLSTKWKTNGLTHRWEMIQIFTLRKVLVFLFRYRFSFRSALFSLPLFVTRTRSGFAVYTICECGMNSGTICALCNWFCGLILWNDIGASPPNEMICPRIACHPSWLGSKWEKLKGRSRALCQSECL